MEFLDGSAHPSQKRVISLGHGDEVLHFPIDLYRNLTANIYTVGDANLLFSQLTPDKQQALWDIYKYCYNKILDVSSDELLTNYLKEILSQIKHIISYEDVLAYVNRVDSFWSPPDPKTVIKTTDMEVLSRLPNLEEEINTAGRETSLTYTQKDFSEMNALIIYMKFYLPILSQYYSRLKVEHENPVFIFYQVLEVMVDTDLEHSAGYQRLRLYIQGYWNGKDTGGLSINMLKNFVSEDLTVQLILSEILFKKVIPIGVSHRHQYFANDDDRPSLIRGLFHSVQTSVEGITSKRGPEHYMNKDTSGRDSGNADDPSSKNEQYRNVAEHTEQSTATANAFCHDLAAVLHQMDPSVPLSDAESVIYEPIYHYSQHPFRTTMMKWLMNRFVSPSLIHQLDERAFGNLFKACIACLRHWGFDELAKTFDGNIEHRSPRENVYELLPISIEQLKLLDIYYPYTMQTNRNKGDARRDVNFATRTFTQVELDIRGYRLRGINYTGDGGSSVWTCMTNIKYQLADLFIYLNERKLLSVR